MFKYILLGVLSVFAMNATAEDIIFTGTSGNSCTFSSVTNGVLNVNGSLFTTTTPAGYVVTNNSANTFKIVVPNSNAFSAFPVGSSMNGDLVQVVSIASGGNSAQSFTGSDSAGYEVNLVANTTDTVTHSVNGNISNAQAGTYTVTVAVTCVAQ